MTDLDGADRRSTLAGQHSAITGRATANGRQESDRTAVRAPVRPVW